MKLLNIHDKDDVNVVRKAIERKMTTNKRGCMVWNGAYAHRTPIIQARLKDGSRVYVSVKRFMVTQANPDADLSDKYRYCNTCGDYHCINPDHIIPCEKDAAKAVEVIAWLKRFGMRYNTNTEMAKAYGCSIPTIGKYRKMYAENPDVWDSLVEGFEYAKKKN